MTNGSPTLVSLFSGAGGLDYGLEKAGFSPRLFLEVCGKCCQTLARNFRGVPIINNDIREVSSDDVLRTSGLRRGEVTLVSGGPPCQPFSTLAGAETRAKALSDPRGNLFYQFARIVEDVRPRAFLLENVPGLLSAENGKVHETIVKVFSGIGYTLNSEVLNAADYGVPQVRKRMIIVGLKEGGKFKFPNPTHAEAPKPRLDGPLKKWVTVGEAFQTITNEDRVRFGDLGLRHSKAMIEKMKMIPPGGNFRTHLPREMWPRCWANGSHQGMDTFGRLVASKPSVTIRTSGYNPTKGRYIHPTEDRGLSTLEMSILQSFPKDYKFGGPLVEVGKQIGNAVPPVLAEQIGKALLEQLGFKAVAIKATVP